MEKYKRFTDAESSINPFLPKNVPLSTGAVFALAPVVLLRIVGFALSMLLLELTVLVDDVFDLLRLTALTRPVLFRPWVALFARLALLSLGVLRVNRGYFPTRPTAAAISPSNVDDCNWPPRKGDAVIANFQTPLDVLVLLVATGGRPVVFAWPNPEGRGQLGLIRSTHSPTQAMLMALRAVDPRTSINTAATDAPQPANSSPLTSGYDVSSRQRTAKRSGRILVFFPEATTSNGRGLLKFVLFRTEQDSSTVLSALTYSTSDHNAVLPSSSVAFVASVALRSGLHATTVDCVAVRPSHSCASLNPFGASAGGNDASGGFSASLVEATREKLASAASHMRLVSAPCKCVGLSVKSKQDFLDQWDSYNRPPK